MVLAVISQRLDENWSLQGGFGLGYREGGFEGGFEGVDGVLGMCDFGGWVMCVRKLEWRWSGDDNSDAAFCRGTGDVFTGHLW